MDFLAQTLPTIEDNLALDEALLEEIEQDPTKTEILRLWESPSTTVVVGRGTIVNNEVDHQACEQDQIPILRRCSGGTSVVAGPGCLMYAVVIRYETRPELRNVDAAHRFVMGRMQKAFLTLDPGVEFLGSCDLALARRKFSGNALRCKPSGFLYHGTILYDFDLALISRYLKSPPREPDYREGRSHADFVRNFPANVQELRSAIQSAWETQTERHDWPQQRTEDLASTKYRQDSWNLRR